MTNLLKKILYLVAAIGFSLALAGSYEDFFRAVKQDNPAAIRELVQRGFDPNTIDPNGEHGLFIALREGSLKVAEVLIDSPKTKVEWRNPHDESPLMMAALKGHFDLVRKLVARDADVNKPGWTPLHYAATHGNPQIVAFLLEHHAFIDAESPNKTTPLMMAAHYGSREAVKLLLAEGADPALKNELGLSAFDFAHRANRTDVAEMVASAIRASQPKGKW
jgi:ankyrin repeat protein